MIATNVASLTAESVGYIYDNGDNILRETRASAHSAGSTNIVNNRQFDSWGRLTQASQNLNNAGDKIISQLSYTAKDQLNWKKLGNGLQQIDYGYLPNGLLSNINGAAAWPGNTAVSGMLTNFNTPTFTSNNNADLFREVLNYNTFPSELPGIAQQNGNIGQMIWQVRGRTTQAYSFTYDYLDRLTASKYSDYTTSGSIDPVDYFGESLSFDIRGNVTGITRKGLVKGATKYTAATIDTQTMTVQSGTNRSTGSTGPNSTSAASANMDAPHNHLNLPSKFDFGSNNIIELLYDGAGNKLKKTVKTNNVVTLTQDYLDGIELKNNVVEAVYNEEGRAFNNAGSFRYEFALRDHLGNTRVVFTDKDGAGIQDNTEILSETHYYPFGKTMEGAWYNDATAPKYKYLYNGKELSEEFNLNFYDYGARWLDPGIGSWWEVDPLSENSRRWSPYAYGNNNPIRFIDPDGRESSAYGGFTSSAEIAERFAASAEAHRARRDAKADADADQDDDKKKTRTNEKGQTVDEKGNPVFDSRDPMNSYLIFDQRSADDPTRIIDAVISYALPGFKSLSLFSKMNPFAKYKSAKDIVEFAGSAIGKNAIKMSPDDIGDFLNAGKNWHKTRAKQDFLRAFQKELKGDTNADFWIDKATNEVILKSNKSKVWVPTGMKLE